MHAFAHVTGGGIPGNLTRVLPAGLGAEIRRGAWPEPRIFAAVAEAGGVADEEMVRVFNLGLGMLAVVPDGEVAGAVALLAAAGHAAYEVGRIVDGDGVGGVAVARRARCPGSSSSTTSRTRSWPPGWPWPPPVTTACWPPTANGPSTSWPPAGSTSWSSTRPCPSTTAGPSSPPPGRSRWWSVSGDHPAGAAPAGTVAARLAKPFAAGDLVSAVEAA